MNKNEPPLLPEALNQSTPNRGISRKGKIGLALSIGASSAFLASVFAWVAAFVVVVGGFGEAVILIFVPFIGLGVCFLITQYCLSCGNPQALRMDGSFILAMNLAPFSLVFIALAVLGKWAGLAMLVVTIITLACSYAGAALAKLIARRRLRVFPPALG